jgi:hypothetical protein
MPLVELPADPVELPADPVEPPEVEPPDVAELEELVDVDGVVLDVEVEVAAALSATPEMRPTVRAPAAAAATVAATAARLVSARPFMATTFAGAASAPPHRSVKASSSLPGCPIRARAAPT